MRKKEYNEIRYDEQNQVDDVAIGNLHFERMDKDCFWLAYYDGNKRTSFWFRSKSRIDVVIQENSLKTKEVKWEKFT